MTYNSGFSLDGIAVLASTNDSWTPLYARLLNRWDEPPLILFRSLNQLVSSVIPYSLWTRKANGINYEGEYYVLCSG